MGGPGPRHKSERARLARLANMAKARAARKRAPLRWRSGLESRIIEQLVWQWWQETSGQWLVANGWKRQQPIFGRGDAGQPANREIGVPGRPATVGGPCYANAPAGKPWAKLRVAQLLGVSHTWVNKLVKRFEEDPERARRRMAAFAPATLGKLEGAREETRRQREMGWLRGPIRMRRVKWTLGGKTQRAIVWTYSEKRRQEGKAEARLSVPYAEVPLWARGAAEGG
jgi:hypothetical protein